MKKYEISWFEEFECLCGDCPNTCCRGWLIPLEGRDRKRFRKTRGLLGLRLFLATRFGLGSYFNYDSGTCPFCDKDGLCMLQKEKGHDFIPWTCQSFPRFYRNYGEFEEICLDLSCPEAARLFLKNDGSLRLREYDAEAVTQPCATNDDPDYLHFLIRQRTEMIDAVSKGLSGRLTDTLFAFSIRLQDVFARNEAQDLGSLSFETFWAETKKDDPHNPFSFPLPADVLKGFLESSLYHIKLKKVNPKLFELFTKASVILDRYTGSSKDWQETASSYLKQHPDITDILGSYLSCHLFQYWLRTYETYSFRRQVALGLSHTNMILLLAIAVSENGPISQETIADMISVYNRRAFFSEIIQDQMYRIFESHYRLSISL